MVDTIKVYKAYMHAKFDPKKTVTDVGKEFGITRADVYEIVRLINKGRPAKIEKCSINSRLDCLWKYKYKDQFLVIPKDRKAMSVFMLKNLFVSMFKDGFNVFKIHDYTGKDRSTIRYHLKNYENTSKSTK